MEIKIKNVKKFLLISLSAVILYILIQNPQRIKGVITFIFSVFSPFFIGFCLAFIFNIPLKFFENKISLPEKIKRPICLIITYLSFFSVIFLVYFFVVPELKKSFELLLRNLPEYLSTLELWIGKLTERFNLTETSLDNVQMLLGSIGENAKRNMPRVLDGTMDIVRKVISSVAKLLIGFVFSVYILLQKERLCKNVKKILFAFLNSKKVDFLTALGGLSNEIFAKFVFGQFTEVIIIGVLCFIGMKIFSMPYALLISVIISITAFIPFFGAFIGTGFGVILLLVIKPITAFWFVVFIIVLQQIEGNFIYPRVVGSSIGLPGILVLSAVVLGNNLFGVAGMILGAPVSAVFYAFFRGLVNKKVSDKCNCTRDS